MAVPAADLEVGTLAGDDALLERLLFEAIDATEGDDIVAAVVRLHALAVRARAPYFLAGWFCGTGHNAAKGIKISAFLF